MINQVIAGRDIQDTERDDVRDMLLGLLEQIDSGEITPNRCIIIFADEQGDKVMSDIIANTNNHEVIALMEVSKMFIMQRMGVL